MSDPALVLGDMAAAKHLKFGDALIRSAGRSEWSRAGLSGRLVEIFAEDSSALLTVAFGLVLDAQREKETSAWVTSRGEFFFPPDAAEGGVDLNALPVILVPDGAVGAYGHTVLLKAADKLARSGAFGLIVIDMPRPHPRPLSTYAERGWRNKLGQVGGEVADGALSRLLGLAQKHDIAIVFLTRPSRAETSLGSLVSLRGRAMRARNGAEFHKIEMRALKDKRRAPGWTHEETCRGPAGLR